MTDTSLEHLIAFAVPHTAMCQAIATIHPLGGGFDRTRLRDIAVSHGGGQILAEALELRLGLVGLLYQIDPTVARSQSISIEDLARILIELPLSIENGALTFDGDVLAARLRLVGEHCGHA
jgi:hypothetical protein